MSVSAYKTMADYPRKAAEIDDTERLKRAVADLHCGEQLLLSPKADGSPYLVSDEIVLPEGISVRGNGITIKQTVREKNIFSCNSHNLIEDIRFEGDNGTNGVNFVRNNGIFSGNSDRLVIRNCVFSGFESAGIQLRDVHDVLIEGNFFDNNYWGAFSNSSDIIVYSGIGSKRIVIRNNYCHSDNSQAIFVNPNGLDTEILIEGNICSTLNSDRSEKVTPSQRRHGIVAAYNGNSLGSKVTITNNLIKNTRWSGIYINSNNKSPNNQVGEYIVTNNHVINTATATDTSLQGGIAIFGGGFGDIVANNIIENVANAPGINLNHGLTGNNRTVVHHNTIKHAKQGIYANTLAKNLSIESNTIKDSAGADITIAVLETPLDAKVKIVNNHCERSSVNWSIFVDSQYSNNQITIAHNDLYGTGNLGDTSIQNTGIYVRKTPFVKVTENYIKGFYFGIHYEDIIVGRVIDKIKIADNTLENLAVGVVIKANNAAAVVPLISNTFVKVADHVSGLGSYNAGYIGYVLNDRLVLSLPASPTAGTFVIGDRFENPSPVEGGVLCGVCVAEGSPGTWKTKTL